MTDAPSPRQHLRHCLATIAYRGGKTLRGVPDSFANFSAGQGSRTPAQVLAHMGDLMEWALSIAAGQQTWRDSQPLAWKDEIQRFFGTLKTFDDFLAGDQPLQASPERLFQGPLADTLTHIGQIAMLRRLAGASIKGENYFAADIAAGRVGEEQIAPKREF